MAQEIDSGRRGVRGCGPGPCGEEVEKEEDIAGVCGVPDGSLRRGEAIVWDGDGEAGELDEAACELRMLGLVLAAAAGEGGWGMRQWDTYLLQAPPWTKTMSGAG